MGAWLGYWFNIKNPHPFPCKLLCCSFPFNGVNPISIICNRNETFKLQNSHVREQEHGGKAAKWWELVRALASHQCGPGSKPVIDATRGLSLLLVLSHVDVHSLKSLFNLTALLALVVRFLKCNLFFFPFMCACQKGLRVPSLPGYGNWGYELWHDRCHAYFGKRA